MQYKNGVLKIRPPLLSLWRQLSVTVRDRMQVVVLIFFCWSPGKTQDWLQQCKLIFLWENQHPHPNCITSPHGNFQNSHVTLSFSHNTSPWEHEEMQIAGFANHAEIIGALRDTTYAKVCQNKALHYSDSWSTRLQIHWKEHIWTTVALWHIRVVTVIKNVRCIFYGGLLWSMTAMLIIPEVKVKEVRLNKELRWIQGIWSWEKTAGREGREREYFL